MKKACFFIAVLMASFTGIANSNEPPVSIEISEKAPVSVSIIATHNGEPVQGALVKIVSNRIVIGAGTTDAQGKADVKIEKYNSQVVIIEVYHRLYKTKKSKNVVLSAGAVFTYPLKSKSETVAEIATETEEKEAKRNEQIKKTNESQEEYEKRMEEAKKTQEELKTETAAIVKKAEDEKKALDEKKKEAEEAKLKAEEARKNMEEQERANAERIDK